ncbi:MAG: hypothetical protein E7651_07330 [Ruminococcaceae bacterium]|nr:hypothetical protein [Oscillospiraceae bacterium]
MPEVKRLKCSEKTKTLAELAEDLKAELGAEVACHEKLLNDHAVLLCLEQYYFRCSNYVALSVMMVDNGDCQEAVLAGFAGGDGLNISFGANKSFVRKALKVLEKAGFSEV